MWGGKKITLSKQNLSSHIRRCYLTVVNTYLGRADECPVDVRDAESAADVTNVLVKSACQWGVLLMPVPF